jgi:hypothetical protein
MMILSVDGDGVSKATAGRGVYKMGRLIDGLALSKEFERGRGRLLT